VFEFISTDVLFDASFFSVMSQNFAAGLAIYHLSWNVYAWICSCTNVCIYVRALVMEIM
jgi:hypothetical protein